MSGCCCVTHSLDALPCGKNHGKTHGLQGLQEEAQANQERQQTDLPSLGEGHGHNHDMAR
jgi:hypothetical protein